MRKSKINKILSIILAVSITITGFTIVKFNNDDSFSKLQVQAFSNAVKSMDGDVDNRLVISADKGIDTYGATDKATLGELSVLQYNSKEEAQKAYEMLSADTGVNAICFDSCDIKSQTVDNDFTCQDYSTAYTNIDDSIKLLKKHNLGSNTIKVAVIDSGVDRNSFTDGRLDGGYCYIDGYSDDGTDDRENHGSMVASSIIMNTMDNVRIYSYQVLNEEGKGNITNGLAAIYQAVADGCKIINCSFSFTPKVDDNESGVLFENAVNYAIENGSIVVGAAGNERKRVEAVKAFPAIVDGALTIGASNQINEIANFSNIGDCVDFFAPGENLNSYDNTGAFVDGGFTGTSASCAVASAICANLLSADDTLTVDEIRSLIVNNSNSLWTETQNSNEIIPDCYSATCSLLNDELEVASLDYDISKIESSGYCNVSITASDNANVYYFANSMDIHIPYRDNSTSGEYLANGNIALSKSRIVTLCAYEAGKAKCVKTINAPKYQFDRGYRVYDYFDNDGVVDNFQHSGETTVTIPESINGLTIYKVHDYTFMGDKDIETIILPDSVWNIGKFAFANCPNLKRVVANGAEQIDMFAFYNCPNLEVVECKSLTQANVGVCQNCPSLTEFTTSFMNVFCNQAFDGCSNLEVIKTVDSGITAGYKSFNNCDKLCITAHDGSEAEQFASDNSLGFVPIACHQYVYQYLDRGSFVYKCRICGDKTQVHYKDATAEWKSLKYINKQVTIPNDDMSFCLDFVRDGVINGKDYAYLHYWTGDWPQ